MNSGKKRIIYASQFRDLLNQGPVLLPGTFYPFGALQIEAAGFRACYLSGAALSTSLGLLDEGFVSRQEVTEAVKKIRRVTDLPIIVDADVGLFPQKQVDELLRLRKQNEKDFRDFCLKNPRYDLDSITLTVRSLEEAGAAGLHLEDQIWYLKRCGHLEGKQLISKDYMSEKIRIACQARRNSNFMIIARTDARATEGLESAISRARAYIEAGADAIFPEALESKKEFRIFRREFPGIPLMANLAEQGRTPAGITAKYLIDLGYNMILFPVTGVRAMYKAFADTLAEIQKSGSVKRITEKGAILTRQEVNELIKRHSVIYRKNNNG